MKVIASKSYNKIKTECDCGTAAATGGTSFGSGIGANDVLGTCDHQKDGCMGKGCFHIPKVLPLAGGEGSKRRKSNKVTAYEKGMKLFNEAELAKKTIMGLHRLGEGKIKQFVQSYGTDIRCAYIQAIVYFPVDKTLFIKFMDSLTRQYMYVKADFDGTKLVKVNSTIYTTAAAREEYLKILQMPGNHIRNTSSADEELWVIWGGV